MRKLDWWPIAGLATVIAVICIGAYVGSQHDGPPSTSVTKPLSSSFTPIGYDRPVFSLAFAPNCTVAYGDQYGVLHTWDNLKEESTISNGATIRAIGWKSNGLLAAADDNGMVTLVEVPKLKQVHTFQTRPWLLEIGWVGDNLVTIHRNGLMNAWGTTGKSLGSFRYKGDAEAAKVFPDHRRVAIATPQDIQIWDMARRQRLEMWEQTGTSCLAISQDGTEVWSGLQDGTIHGHGLRIGPIGSRQVSSRPIAGIALTRYGVVAGDDTGTITLLSPNLDRVIQTGSLAPNDRGGNGVFVLNASHDGTIVGIGGVSGAYSWIITPPRPQ